jgi:DNA-directed RNA polymerase specialized sigma24 family protein
MRQAALYSVQDVTLWLYEWIIDFYTPYILIRCTGFTNSKAQAERIAVYGLITTCLLAAELERLNQVGLLVDILVDVIGEDLTGQETEPATPRPDGAGGPLLPEEGMRELAEALNRLDGFTREVLVFGHMEAVDTKALACLFHTSTDRIETEMARGERQLAQRLRHACGGRRPVSGADVPALLAELATALDPTLADRVADLALAYLTGCSREGTTVLASWTLN